MIPTFEQVMDVTKDVSSIVMFTPEECRGLYEALAHVPNGGLVIEVGCDYGRSSSIIIQMAAAKKFHSIHIDPYHDHPEYAQHWINYMLRVRPQHWPFLFFCGKTVESVNFLDILFRGEACLDLAFIDGDHYEPAIKVDLAFVGKNVKHGGLLVAHDYGDHHEPFFPDVKRLFDEFTQEGWVEFGTYERLKVWRRL